MEIQHHKMWFDQPSVRKHQREILFVFMCLYIVVVYVISNNKMYFELIWMEKCNIWFLQPPLVYAMSNMYVMILSDNGEKWQSSDNTQCMKLSELCMHWASSVQSAKGTFVPRQFVEQRRVSYNLDRVKVFRCIREAELIPLSDCLVFGFLVTLLSILLNLYIYTVCECMNKFQHVFAFDVTPHSNFKWHR